MFGKKLTRGHAVFIILAWFAAVDGDVDDTEIETVMDFINNNFDELDFDFRKEAEFLGNTNAKKRAERLSEALEIFKNDPLSQKFAIIDECHNVILADGEVAERERDLLKIVLEEWNISAAQYNERYA